MLSVHDPLATKIRCFLKKKDITSSEIATIWLDVARTMLTREE
ncbi:hypothetical protein PR002_g27602 [Phytophthora rubi]|uniref:Uncharacterized protein n=1 Tax=Phytophthora rubi TaxID=129364 RepID=A0A6A3HH95_9STRA|nr:hypothetical protein PR002_g27602 [Phytophthora rubi]